MRFRSGLQRGLNLDQRLCSVLARNTASNHTQHLHSRNLTNRNLCRTFDNLSSPLTWTAGSGAAGYVPAVPGGQGAEEAVLAVPQEVQHVVPTSRGAQADDGRVRAGHVCLLRLPHRARRLPNRLVRGALTQVAAWYSASQKVLRWLSVLHERLWYRPRERRETSLPMSCIMPAAVRFAFDFVCCNLTLDAQAAECPYARWPQTMCVKSFEC